MKMNWWWLIILVQQILPIAESITTTTTNANFYHIEQCIQKIIDDVQPCSEEAIQNWNLNHSFFVPSKWSTCCANWQVYECFIQAALAGCTLFEFQALVNNMTTDAIILQRNNCSRYKYHSENCSNGSGSDDPKALVDFRLMFFGFVLVFGLFD